MLYLVALVVFAIPLGAHIKNAMSGEKTILSRVLTPCENAAYKAMRIDKNEQMNWKEDLLSVLLFNAIGLVMLFVRFLPIVGTPAISGSLVQKKRIATTAGTLSTTNAMFAFLLIVIVLLVGALSFFPALLMGLYPGLSAIIYNALIFRRRCGASNAARCLPASSSPAICSYTASAAWWRRLYSSS